MTSKLPLDKLEKLWNVGKLTIEQMIGQFFVYFKDYHKRFAVHERRLLQLEQAVNRLTGRIDALEATQETTRKELIRLKAQVKGQDQASPAVRSLPAGSSPAGRFVQSLGFMDINRHYAVG